VGLVTGAGFTSFGHRVRVVEVDPQRFAVLERNEIPFFEPGLAEQVEKARRQDLLSFHSTVEGGLADADVVFVAVPTPPDTDGKADLSVVETVLREIAHRLASGSIVAVKSTVPPGSARRFQAILDEAANGLVIASNPEFLSQGEALEQFLNPDRIVIGTDDANAERVMMALYASVDCPFVVTDPTSAELIKYSSNAFLAMRISFINAIARVADLVGGNVDDVSVGIGHDPRIGRAFLRPGPGFGGSCLPKDTSALVGAAAELGYDFHLLESVLSVNREQIDYIVARLGEGLDGLQGKRVAVWGLAFKAGTDDTRDSPASDIVRRMLADGADVVAYDPMAAGGPDGTERVSSPLDAIDGADGLLVATEWPEFHDVDFEVVASKMRGRLVVDARNVLDRAVVRRSGLRYVGVGRGNR
jgi:UDPglucose 6-dehydrogenase